MPYCDASVVHRESLGCLWNNFGRSADDGCIELLHKNIDFDNKQGLNVGK